MATIQLLKKVFGESCSILENICIFVEMSGLYIHIPFCKRQCGYCDFARTTKLRLMPSVTQRMHEELRGEVPFLADRKIRTIYFGGGTPSLLRPAELEQFIEEAREMFDCKAVEEITAEVNPDDVTAEYVEALRRTSINRVSMGIQSLDDECLRFMGRRHTAAKAIEAVRLLQRGGFDNLSVDIIFGIEGFGHASLQRTLNGITSLDVQHISAYHLTIEPTTRFGRLLSEGRLRQVAEERSEEEFLRVHEHLTKAGFEHYEVSNYALPGYRSRHNSSYWTGAEYLGIGPGAHSFAGGVRRWCMQSPEEYIEQVRYGSEVLTSRDRLNEYLMTSLRRVEGISLDHITSEFGEEQATRIVQLTTPIVARGALVRQGAQLAIPPEKFLVSDAVIESLFDV